VYSQFVNHVRIKYIETSPETAEAIKYVANTMLLTYISFWNGVGAKIGENFPNVVIDDLRLGVTSDERISTWGSFVSNGAGGSCFGKDIASLINQLRKVNVSTKMLEASYEVNEYQKVYLVDRAITEAGFKFNNKTITVLGLAFKKHTNDMRDASSIKVIESLLGKGAAKIKAYDPLAMSPSGLFSTRPKTFSSTRSTTTRVPKRPSKARTPCSFHRTARNFAGCRGPSSSLFNRPT
jgi:UDPglucose 6-dehydrogenase